MTASSLVIVLLIPVQKLADEDWLTYAPSYALILAKRGNGASAYGFKKCWRRVNWLLNWLVSWLLR